MTLLVCEEKVKFDLHQSIPLTKEERIVCMKIESSFSAIKEHAPMFLQEDTLKGFELEGNLLFIKELAFELTSHNTKVEKPILVSDEDEEEVLAMMDERSTQSSRTSPKSLDGL